MKSIVIAEKPSQQRGYQAAIGSEYGEIYAARGHLFTLMDPEEFNPEWGGAWKAELLRRDRETYPRKLGSDPDYKKRYNAILNAAKIASRIIIATDPDREGQGIGGDILAQLKADLGDDKFGSIEVLRVLPLGDDPASIRQAFVAAQPNNKYRLLYQSYLARTNADKIYGYSMTRAASVTLSDGGTISIGRVQTPTMAMICRREIAIRDFEPEDYFQPWIDVIGSEHQNTARLTYRPKEDGRIFDRNEAETIAVKASGYHGPISVTEERKRQGPPHLFSKSKLQVAARKAYGWSVQKTSDTLQSAYELGLTTYPRSSEVSVPEAEIANAPKLMSALISLGIGSDVSWGDGEPNIRRKKGAFSDKDLRVGTDNPAPHYAIIPQINTADRWADLYEKAPADVRKLFQLVARQYLAAIGPDRIYDATKLAVTIDGRPFTAAGTVEVEPGWKEVFRTTERIEADAEEADEDVGAMPKFRDGETVTETDTGIKTLVTTAPPRLTEDAIAIMMIESWKEVEDPTQRELLKNADNPGIGTESSRDGIVATLKNRNYIRVEKNLVYAGDAGMQLYELLMEIDPIICDVGLTGEMEVGLEAIMKGEAKALSVLDAICDIAAKAIDGMQQAAKRGQMLSASTKAKRGPSDAMKNAARSKAKREGKKAPPSGVLSDFDKCRDYLGPMPERNENGEYPASKGQRDFAEKLAKEKSIPVPEHLFQDRKRLSEWIEANKGSSDRQPTSAQVGFAEKIATRKRINIPDEYYRSSQLLSRWIDSNK